MPDVTRSKADTRLTPEQAQLACGLIAEWFEADVRAAEAKLAAAEAEVQKIHAQRRAWQNGEPLTPMQVVLCRAAQSLVFQDAARRVLDGTCERDEALSLRASGDILKRYLHDAYGTDEEEQR